MAKPDWQKFRNDLFKWGGFGVFVSVLPVGLSYIQRITDNEPHNFVEILANGELVLVSAVLAAGSLGELLARERKEPIPKFERLLILWAGLILFGGGWFYSSLSRNAEARGAQEHWAAADPTHVADFSHAGNTAVSALLSGVAFGFMLLVGVCSIYMMSLEDG